MPARVWLLSAAARRFPISSATGLPGASKVAIGVRLAENIGARVGDTITIINPQGRSTPFGTVPRQVGYEVAAIFEVGVYDYDGAFVVMPMQDAQTLLLIGETVGMIEVTVEDADAVGDACDNCPDVANGPAEADDAGDQSDGDEDGVCLDGLGLLVVVDRGDHGLDPGLGLLDRLGDVLGEDGHALLLEGLLGGGGDLVVLDGQHAVERLCATKAR